MKTKKNIIAVGSCFIITLLLQIYSIGLVDVGPAVPIGLGMVTVLLGYFFMDEVRKQIEQARKDDRFYFDQMIGHEAEKSLERYTELLNIQKASYTATKKNGEYQANQFNELLLRLEALEKKQAASLYKVVELQKRALEGQKKALNLEINYGKENAKRIMELLRETKQDSPEVPFDKLLSLQEGSQELIREQLKLLEEIKSQLEVSKELAGDFYGKLEAVDPISLPDGEEAKENAPEADWLLEEPELRAVDAEEDAVSGSPEVVPLYSDPNKALTTDEIARLFASFGQ
ncbi:MAG TPA: hypothetical protein GXX75_03045 [Clostridiales bacterium]|nr:hypothetical protein [Clostridiales bacterium]